MLIKVQKLVHFNCFANSKVTRLTIFLKMLASFTYVLFMSKYEHKSQLNKVQQNIPK